MVAHKRDYGQEWSGPPCDYMPPIKEFDALSCTGHEEDYTRFQCYMHSGYLSPSIFRHA